MQIAYTKKAPCELVIFTSQSKTLLMDFARKYNHDKKLSAIDCLKTPLQQTLNRLIYLLAKQYVNPAHNWFLRKENSSTLKPKDLALTCSNSYIANYNQTRGQEFKYYSKRTIQNHLNRLQKLGLIKQIKETSQKQILIHPDLLKFTPNFSHLSTHLYANFDFPLQNLITENKGFQEEKEKNLLPKYPNLENLNNITVSNVNKKECVDFLETSNLETPKTENINGNLETKKEKVAPKRKSDRDAYVQKTIVRFLVWIQAHFYSKYKFLSDTQKEIITDYLENQYNHTSKGALWVTSNLKIRLKLWEKWINKESNKRFTPLPQSFFATGNPNGFDQTTIWLKKQEHKQLKNKMRAKAKWLYRQYIKTYENKYLTYPEKMEEFKNLAKKMERIKTRNPQIYKYYNHYLQAYFNQTKVA